MILPLPDITPVWLPEPTPHPKLAPYTPTEHNLTPALNPGPPVRHVKHDSRHLFASKLSAENELWVPLIEKVQPCPTLTKARPCPTLTKPDCIPYPLPCLSHLCTILMNPIPTSTPAPPAIARLFFFTHLPFFYKNLPLLLSLYAAVAVARSP